MSAMSLLAPVSPEQAQKARAHLRAAESECAFIPDVAADSPHRPIASAAVIGAGTMGGGIAMCFANMGIAVVVIDQSQEALDRGLGRVKRNYAVSVERGSLQAADMERRLSFITGANDISAIAKADIIIEAVFEDMSLKQDLFRQIDQHAKPGAILATNTSGLDIDEIAAVTKRPKDVIGAHFFSPANVMRLLEVVRTRDSAPDVIATLMDLGRRMGKASVLSRVSPGFIGNALLRNYSREALFVVEEGALPLDVDAALTRFGYRMGIFAVHDMAGNDVGLQTKRKLLLTRPKDRRYSDLLITICDLGRLGQKTGKGWHRYENGGRTPIRDTEWEAFLVEESKRLGIERRDISDEEIIKRCIYSMVNEGARLLENGIALRASDIDVVYATGYGFPPDRGGPMFFADTIGLDKVYADIVQFHQTQGIWWEPAPLLARLVKEGKTFADYDMDRSQQIHQGEGA